MPPFGSPRGADPGDKEQGRLLPASEVDGAEFLLRQDAVASDLAPAGEHRRRFGGGRFSVAATAALAAAAFIGAVTWAWWPPNNHRATWGQRPAAEAVQEKFNLKMPNLTYTAEDPETGKVYHHLPFLKQVRWTDDPLVTIPEPATAATSASPQADLAKNTSGEMMMPDAFGKVSELDPHLKKIPAMADVPVPATAAASAPAEAGFPDDCDEVFKTKDPPLLANDLNGIRLPPVCYKKKGPHKVFVIGDWGGILGPHGPVPANNRPNQADFVKGVDNVAQKRVAAQMSTRAARDAPDYILNAGDNFYWGGLDTKCGLVPAYKITPTGQFQWTFEHVYTGEGLEKKPWLGVLGNHDYGGYMFNKGWDQIIAYTWGPGGRWVMPAQYWSTKVHYPGFSVDYWFVDTNPFEAWEPHADPHHNICSKEHNNEDEGCGEVGPKDVWQCQSWFAKLWEDQVPWLEKGLQESTADWQIVVTHFPPTWQSDFWEPLAREYGIDLIVTGHTHQQELHYDDPNNFLYPTAWVISGGGGGITSQSPPHVEGMDDQYGFFELNLTKELIEITGISHGGYVRSTAFVAPRGREGDVRNVDVDKPEPVSELEQKQMRFRK